MRKKRKSKKKYLIIFISLILVLIIFLIFKTGLLNIKKVEVGGDKLSCADENLIEDSLSLLGQNFFTTDKKKLTKILKDKFICIKDINLSRIFPSKVKIVVTSRQPAAILATLKEKLASSTATPSAQDISDLSVIDDEGVIFSKDVENLNIPKVFVSKNPDINFLQILNKIRTLGINIRDSFLVDNFFIINSGDGLRIMFQLNDQIDVQLASLQLILDKAKIDMSSLEFVDLRFDKPVVKFAPKK